MPGKPGFVNCSPVDGLECPYKQKCSSLELNRRSATRFFTAGPVRYQYDSFLRELGAKLRKMRTDRGWTLRRMIVEHGFHLAQWQGFEKGKGISVPTLLRLCEIFDLTLEELIGGLGRENTAQGSKSEETSIKAPAKRVAVLPAAPRGAPRPPRPPRKQ